MLQSQPCTWGSEPGLRGPAAETWGWVLRPPHSQFSSVLGYAGLSWLSWAVLEAFGI